MKTRVPISKFRFTEGDLVFWHPEANHDLTSGVVLEVFPRNVYEPESCLILHNKQQVFIDSKHLRLEKDDK